MAFDHKKCLEDIEEALAPVLEKYRHLIAKQDLYYVSEGLLTAHEALCSIIDPSIEEALRAVNSRPRVGAPN